MKVYTLAAVVTDPITHPLRARREMAMINRMPGLIGAVPGMFAAIFVFGTVAHAEKAQAAFRKFGTSCGKYIMTAELSDDKKHLQIGEPVCGWDNVDPENLRKDEKGNRGVAEMLNNQ